MIVGGSGDPTAFWYSVGGVVLRRTKFSQKLFRPFADVRHGAHASNGYGKTVGKDRIVEDDRRTGGAQPVQRLHKGLARLRPERERELRPYLP